MLSLFVFGRITPQSSYPLHKSLCHQPGTHGPQGVLALALATTNWERKGLGMGLGWYCRAGASIPSTTLSILSTPSGEKAEARTLYIICFNHHVDFNGNMSSHNDKILQHRWRNRQTPKPQEKSLLTESKQLTVASKQFIQETFGFTPL